ncbi:MAG: glycosyltransferase family 39 protein [Anaerolineaceae bacterium]|nr:glycosyltransferase family 39 protein [Anaerolineaceae bacterium]
MYTARTNEEFAISQKLNNLMMSKGWWWALWLVCFAILFAWRTQNLTAFGLSNDEGAHLMWARLAVDGYPLYSETQAVQAPLFIESIGWAFRLRGPTLQAGRWVTLLGFALLTIVLSWLAHRAGGVLTALVALILLGVSPLAFTFSRLVMAEIPATALAVASLGLVFLFWPYERRIWLFASGLALGASFLVKGLNPFVVAPIGLLVWLHRGPQRDSLSRQLISLTRDWIGLLLDGLAWTAGFLLPFGVVCLIYDPAAMYDQLILFRGDLRAAIPGSWPETWGHFELFFKSHWGLWLLAIFGLISTVIRNVVLKPANPLEPDPLIPTVPYNLIWSVWLAAGVLMLLWHTPLFPHHFLVLLPPLILLATTVFTHLAIFWANRARRPALMMAVLLALVIGGAALNLPAMIKANQATAAIVTGGREQQALPLLEAVSQPDDFVMGDSQLLIFMANRRTPPPLGDVALVAIKAGRQTSARLIDLTATYRSPAVVQWSLRLPWLPEYLDWVQNNYWVHRVWDNDHIIHFGRRLPDSEPIPNEQSVRLGDSVTLRGYQLNSPTGLAGQPLGIKVYWQTDLALNQNYTIFTQLLDSSGTLVVGYDSQPLSGYWPTQEWPPGEVVIDLVQLPLPPELSPGEYRLVTGMYLLDTGERLPVLEANQNYITLTTIKIK